jgi:GNAT superfamily N-acetyltransferase
MRKWINLLESYHQAHYIDISEDGCAVEGYVVETAAEQLENWLSQRHRLDLPGFASEMRSRYTTIAFLNNINVDDDARGQGLGNQMMEGFIDEASQHGAEAIILMADLAEQQEDGFDLVRWYQGWGFTIIPTSSNDPLMIMEMDR